MYPDFFLEFTVQLNVQLTCMFTVAKRDSDLILRSHNAEGGPQFWRHRHHRGGQAHTEVDHHLPRRRNQEHSLSHARMAGGILAVVVATTSYRKKYYQRLPSHRVDIRREPLAGLRGTSKRYDVTGVAIFQRANPDVSP